MAAWKTPGELTRGGQCGFSPAGIAGKLPWKTVFSPCFRPLSFANVSASRQMVTGEYTIPTRRGLVSDKRCVTRPCSTTGGDDDEDDE